MLASDIVTRAPFKNVFTIQSKLLATIADSMKAIGFDGAFPLIVWMKDKPVLLDGHTRLKAALQAGVTEVPVIIKHFETDDAAIDYAVRSQRNRRNLSDAEILQCIQTLDKLKKSGRPSMKCVPDGTHFKGRSSKEIADALGVSSRRVERARAVAKSGETEIQDAVKNGDMTVNSAYDALRAKKHAEKLQSDQLTGKFESEEEKTNWHKQTRMESVIDSLDSWFEMRLQREKGEYPDVTYTSSDHEKLLKQAIEIVKTHINAL